MEVDREAEGLNFLRNFLSRFSASCREDAGSLQQQPLQNEPAEAPSVEARILLVRIAGEVLFHCSTHLAQWRAQNPPGEEGEQLLPPSVREGYLYLLAMADYAAGKLWHLESAGGGSILASSTSSSSSGANGGLWRNVTPDIAEGLSHGLTAFIISVLEGGVALQLSPSNVDMAVGIVEKLALPAPPATPSQAPADWPSTPVPDLDDGPFGMTEAVLGPMQESMNRRFWARTPEVSRAGAIGRGSAGGMGAHLAAGKPSLCLVAGDALGARLLGWCTVFCRSPQWRKLFSERDAPSLPTPPRESGGGGGATGVFTGKKRTAEDMEGIPTPTGEASTTHHNDSGRGKDGDPPGLAQLLGVVGQVVRIVKEHTKVAGERPSGVGSFPGAVVGSARVAPGLDQRTKESSHLVQVLVGALADAVLDAFAGHMADPVFHGRLRRDADADGEAAGGPAGVPARRGGDAASMSDVVPLVDGASPVETVGLSVELVSDIAWLFSSLEPEPETGTASSSSRDRGSAAKASPAAVLLSSAMSSWVSGRVLACMPRREHLEYALALSPSAGGNASGGIEAEDGASGQVAERPSIRPLPARLASFAVRTLLDQLQVCTTIRHGDFSPSCAGVFLRSAVRRALHGLAPGRAHHGADAGVARAAAAPPSPSRWTSLVVGQRLTSCVDRAHLAGLLLAWEAWHPWMEKEAPAPASSAAGRLSLRQARTWQTFCSLMGHLAQGCVSPRPSPPPGQGLVDLVTQTALSLRTAVRKAGDPLPFMDMPAVLLLCKTQVALSATGTMEDKQSSSRMSQLLWDRFFTACQAHIHAQLLAYAYFYQESQVRRGLLAAHLGLVRKLGALVAAAASGEPCTEWEGPQLLLAQCMALAKFLLRTAHDSEQSLSMTGVAFSRSSRPTRMPGCWRCTSGRGWPARAAEPWPRRSPSGVTQDGERRWGGRRRIRVFLRVEAAGHPAAGAPPARGGRRGGCTGYGGRASPGRRERNGSSPVVPGRAAGEQRGVGLVFFPLRGGAVLRARRAARLVRRGAEAPERCHGRRCRSIAGPEAGTGRPGARPRPPGGVRTARRPLRGAHPAGGGLRSPLPPDHRGRSRGSSRGGGARAGGLGGHRGAYLDARPLPHAVCLAVPSLVAWIRPVSGRGAAHRAEQPAGRDAA
ncbi:unnamed protein product [Scytosiphon promiscuus]